MEQATFFDLAVNMDVQKDNFIKMNRKKTQKKVLAFRKGQKKETPHAPDRKVLDYDNNDSTTPLLPILTCIHHAVLRSLKFDTFEC